MEILLVYGQGILEALGAIALTLVFSRVKISWGTTIVVAFLVAVVVVGIRSLPIVFGIHMLVSIVIIFAYITLMTDAPKTTVFISVFASFFCLAIMEYSLNQIFINLKLLHTQDVVESSRVWMMMGYMQGILMNILAVFLQQILKPQNSWKKKVNKQPSNPANPGD